MFAAAVDNSTHANKSIHLIFTQPSLFFYQWQVDTLLNCSDEVWAYRVQNSKTKAIHNTDIRNDATCARLVHVS